MDKLLPCPFCGGKVEIDMLDSENSRNVKIYSAVHCPKCHEWFFKGLSRGKTIAAWNRRAEPENEPLTLEELREMDGEPVWVCFLNSKVSVSGQWHLVRNITKEVINCFENYMPFCDYGKTWLAYRHKPEEDLQC